MREKIRQQDRIEAGPELEIERIDRGEYVSQTQDAPAQIGLVKLLLACPVKDWFQPMDRTETTNDIVAPKLG